MSRAARSAASNADWGGMLRTAAALGIAPRVFWRLSLKEWRMLTARADGAAPLGRAAFERLAAAWPDDDTQRLDRLALPTRSLRDHPPHEGRERG